MPRARGAAAAPHRRRSRLAAVSLALAVASRGTLPFSAARLPRRLPSRRMAQKAFDSQKKQVFVVGNEAADVDSLVSAYALARLFDGPDVEGVPVAQIPREEFRLRGDGLALFKAASSEVLPDGSPAGLRFWNEIDWQAVQSLEDRAVVLTDHNKMTEKVTAVFQGRVQLILDHHANTNAHPEAAGEIVEGLGSACTLVAEQLLNKTPELPEEIGLLLAGVILLDTRNFDLQEKKGTPRDVDAFERLRAYMPKGLEQKQWYKDLTDARHDVSHLSVKELLMLDMKAAAVEGFDGEVAFSAMMTTLGESVERAGGAAELRRQMQEFAQQRGYTCVVCNFAKDKSGFKAVAFAPATEERAPVAEAVEARLRDAPQNLPESLLRNDLYVSQGILEHGFGLTPKEDLAPLRAFTLRPLISRKTLLPRATMAAVAPASL